MSGVRRFGSRCIRVQVKMSQKCLLVVLLLAGSAWAAQLSPQQRSTFDQFLKKFHLTYASNDYEKRFRLFDKNLKRIDEFNKRSKAARFAPNKFAAMTAQEIKQVSNYWKVPNDLKAT